MVIDFDGAVGQFDVQSAIFQRLLFQRLLFQRLLYHGGQIRHLVWVLSPGADSDHVCALPSFIKNGEEGLVFSNRYPFVYSFGCLFDGRVFCQVAGDLRSQGGGGLLRFLFLLVLFHFVGVDVDCLLDQFALLTCRLIRTLRRDRSVAEEGLGCQAFHSSGACTRQRAAR